MNHEYDMKATTTSEYFNFGCERLRDGICAEAWIISGFYSSQPIAKKKGRK